MKSRHRIAATAAILCAIALVSTSCSGDQPGTAAAKETATTTSIDSPATTTTGRVVPFTAPAAPRTSAASKSAPSAPEVIEQGWSLVADGDFGTFGVHVRNNGPAAKWSTVTVTAIDASGTPLETISEDLAFLGAGADAYIGGTFIDSPEMTDIKVTTDAGQPLSGGDRKVTITAAAKLLGTGYDTRVAVTASSDSSIAVKSPERIFYVFRDSAGAIVGGMWGFTQSDIPPGGSINESTPVTGFAPASSTSVEVTINASVS